MQYFFVKTPAPLLRARQQIYLSHAYVPRTKHIQKSVTEVVYTHFEVGEPIDAINKI